MNKTIDELLVQPLTSVADEGFSRNVMARVRKTQRRGRLVTAAGALTFMVLALLVLPLQKIGEEIGWLVPTIATSAAFNLAAAIIVLTLLLERQFSRL